MLNCIKCHVKWRTIFKQVSENELIVLSFETMKINMFWHEFQKSCKYLIISILKFRPLILCNMNKMLQKCFVLKNFIHIMFKRPTLCLNIYFYTFLTRKCHSIYSTLNVGSDILTITINNSCKRVTEDPLGTHLTENFLRKIYRDGNFRSSK